jgi:hypothetical protein
MVLIGQWVDMSVMCDMLVGYDGGVRWAVLDERLGGFLKVGVGGKQN